MNDNHQDLSQQDLHASGEEHIDVNDPQFDEQVAATPYETMLKQDAVFRKRWFKLFQVGHRELVRVAEDVTELMDPDNEVKLISLIGMTGIGKTTLASELHRILHLRYAEEARSCDCPVIYVHAPANGERSLSWKVLYRRILQAGRAPDIDATRAVRIEDGRLQGVRGPCLSVAHLREQVEFMLKSRKVRALIIDEALHLLRFHDYSAIMDTLKSLADIENTKLILIGTHQIAALMTEYGQVIRRSEIVHYKRYRMASKEGAAPTADEQEYIAQLRKFQDHWPSYNRPDLEANWRLLMRASLGSIGITKAMLQQLVVLQLATPGEQIKESHFSKALKAPSNLAKIEAETVTGEAQLDGCCYGDGEPGLEWAPLETGRRQSPTQGGRHA